MSTFRFGCADFTVTGTVGSVPPAYAAVREHARVHDDLGLFGSEGTPFVVDLSSNGSAWPVLLVALRYSPGADGGFYPGVFLVPEHHRLFIGAGTRLLCYDLAQPRRLWSDEADTGFWCWARHADTILMSAELELAASDLAGRKLWTTFVEPPWEYAVEAGTVLLDVMGKKSCFPLTTGPTMAT